MAFYAQTRSDVDRLHQVLVDIGAVVLDPPAEYPQYGSGYYALFFADPDGLKLEFVFRARPKRGIRREADAWSELGTLRSSTNDGPMSARHTLSGPPFSGHHLSGFSTSGVTRADDP